MFYKTIRNIIFLNQIYWTLRKKNRMESIEFCNACGVPRTIGRDLAWQNNGVIGITLTPGERMVFYESDNIDKLFSGIEDLIGLPIEHIVIESRRRAVRSLMEKAFWGKIAESKKLDEEAEATHDEEERKVKRRSTMKLRIGLNLKANDMGRIYGYGSVLMTPPRGPGDEFPWRSQVVTRPYSLVFYAGDHLGTVEAFEQADMRITYEEVDEDLIRFTAFPGDHPIGLAERLKKHRYDFKPGNISYPRCVECDVPSEVGGHFWNTEEGTVTDVFTSTRMAFFDPSTLDAVIDDLAAELGDPILDLVVEAQRRYIKSINAVSDWSKDWEYFRNWAALRGLGNITSFEASDDGIMLTMENSCLPLSLVGTAQAFFEMAMGIERSKCRWENREDGVLSLEVGR